MIRRLERLCLFLLSAAMAHAEPPSVDFRDGDRVVLIGNTFIEREQSYGHLETWLTTALADREITFRNLGWSGDTVFCHARSYFGPPAEGFERLAKDLDELKPTLILSAYGAVAASEGEAGLADFVAGYKKLLNLFEQAGARIVLLSPPPAENLPAPLPKQDAHNARLALYTDAIAGLAKENGHGFADVFTQLREAWPHLPHPLTGNGIHFTEKGYSVIAPLVVKSLGIELEPPAIDVDAPSGRTTLSGFTLDAVTASPEAVVLRTLAERAYPSELILKVTGLAKGHYAIETHRPLAKVTAEQLAEGVSLPEQQWNPSLPALRRAILKKNELFFHRWRPQNETYLFGFRKHEQGNNAVEIPRFAPLIHEQESRIQTLKRANTLTLTIKKH